MLRRAPFEPLDHSTGDVLAERHQLQVFIVGEELVDRGIAGERWMRCGELQQRWRGAALFFGGES